MHKNNKLKKLILSALFAAIVAVATMIRIPAIKGYINLGDIVVILSGWILGPAYGFASAGIGSMLTDLLSGYTLYAPATFLIKGLMAIISYITYKAFSKTGKTLIAGIISAILSEFLMILGYFLYETILFGIPIAIVSLSGDLLQAVFGTIGSVLLYEALLKRVKRIENLR